MKANALLNMLIGLLLITTTQANAAAIGEIISYQGKLTDTAGAPVANGTYSVTFKIHENGTVKFTQTSSVATLGGVFSAFLSTANSVNFDPGKAYELGVTFNGSETKQSIASVPVAQTAKSIVGPGVVPVGMITIWWSDGTIPTGWAVCDGSSINNLASPLNGKVLPDLRDKFVRGVANSNLRVTPQSGGSDTKILSVDQMPSHSHGVNDSGHSHSAGIAIGWGTAGPNAAYGRVDQNGGHPSQGWAAWTNTANTGIAIQNTGGGQPFSVIPAYVGLVYVMRIF